MEFYPPVKHSNGYNDNSLWYKLCNCCPYGYHIDLDFVQYCNSLEHVYHTASMKRRKDRRRQRRSMVVLLGLEPLSANENLQKDQGTRQETQVHIEDGMQLKKPHQEKELDAEQKLQNSKMLDIESAKYLTEALQCSLLPISTTPDSKMTTSPSTSKSGGVEQGSGLLPADLQNIREQMALSLERTRIVEELVKHIPLLQAQVAELKEEKRQLILQLKMNKSENCVINGQLHSNSISPVQKSMQSPHRAFKDSCSLSPLSETQELSVLQGNVKDKYSDKWYKEKSSFLNDGILNTCSCNNETNKKINRTIVAKETQTTLPRDKRDSSIQTLNTIDDQKVKDIQQYKKLFRSVGISACAHTTETGTEPIMKSLSNSTLHKKTADVSVSAYFDSDDKTKAISKQLNIEIQRSTTGCQYESELHLVDKSIQCATNSIDIENNCKKCISKKGCVNVSTNTNLFIDSVLKHSVSCQYQYHGLHKTCQVDFKLKDKAVQYDIPEEVISNKFSANFTGNEIIDTSLNKKSSQISLSSLTIPRSKSFCLIGSRSNRTIGCQYESSSVHKSTQALYEVQNTAVQCEDVSYFTKFTTKLVTKEASCKTEETSLLKPQDESLPQWKDNSVTVQSKIPRLQSTPKTSKLRRYDTYNVDLYKSDSVFPKTEEENDDEASTVKDVDREDNLPNTYISTGSSLYSEMHIDNYTQRKKIQPSKSMRAALKVLNDCLKKGITENLDNHLKNPINIIQLEWFKVAGLINANPLDVEDYLDYFEDISLILLRYIVNMVDTNGNSVMHYAVSHGNFDVVSILLDSKVCDVNQVNKAGYTSVMLVSLVEITSSEHVNVVRRLFKLADVNVKAKQHGQTALMLAVSHGRLDMVQLLLEAGADINIQDEDGSTALMCASEHGHIEIVKLFLDQPECDSTIADIDGSTALTIAMEAGHRAIGVLLYSHQRLHKMSSQHSKVP